MQINIKKLVPEGKAVAKYVLILTGVLLFLFVGMYGATALTSTPDFCKTCHIMKPEYVTWQASSHSQISCVKCHVDSGLVNEMKHKVVATKELYMYLTKTYELPIIMTEELPDARCLQCHSLKRKITPTGDLYIPHDKHAKQGVPCIKCHQGVAHGKIATRGETMGGDFSNWDLKKGRELMSQEYTQPKMELCMDCHQRRNVTIACEACHTGNIMPDSHRRKDFKVIHGQLARKSIDYCATCHDFITANGGKSLELEDKEQDIVSQYLDRLIGAEKKTTAASYAANNSYCSDCHRKRPPSHNDNWAFEHGIAANKGPNTEKCMVCHSPRTDVPGTTSKGACSSCHPSIHKYDWRKSHPIPVPPRYGRLEKKCLQCHVQDLCGSCHRTS